MAFNDDESDLSEASSTTETSFIKATRSITSFKPARITRNKATRKGFDLRTILGPRPGHTAGRTKSTSPARDDTREEGGGGRGERVAREAYYGTVDRVEGITVTGYTTVYQPLLQLLF